MQGTDSKTQGQIRHLLTTLGGIGIGLGWISADQLEGALSLLANFGGPLAVIVGAFWSWFAKG